MFGSNGCRLLREEDEAGWTMQGRLYKKKNYNHETYRREVKAVGTAVELCMFSRKPRGCTFDGGTNLNEVTQGRATIPMSSLNDNHSDRVQWWPIFHDGHECIGKVQLSIGSTITCDKTNSIKVTSSPLAERRVVLSWKPLHMIYCWNRLYAQYFYHRKLRLDGAWQWLLTGFSD